MSSSEEEAEFGDEESDDEPLAGLKTSKGGGNSEDDEQQMNGSSKRRRSAAKNISYAEDDDDDAEDDDAFEGEEEAEDEDLDADDDDDDDEDDDVPLAALKSTTPKKKSTPAKKNGKKASTPASKKKKKTTPVKKETSTSSDNYQSPSAALYGSDCQKGQLIQKLLCRWWYAITWPDPSKIPDKPPKHYDPLDGIPGVYVCTSGDDVGKIKDFRDKDQCPNFVNFSKKPAEELQSLLIKAIKEQKRILVETEGPGTPTEKELNVLLKWAEKVKPASADKEAVKVLKAAKMTLS